MDFEKLISSYTDNILQHILFEENGDVVKSTNTIIKLKEGDNLYHEYPLIYGIYHTFDNIEENSFHMPRVELKGLSGIYDVFVSKLIDKNSKKGLFFLTLHDNTLNNQYLLEVQQERNNAVIAEELAQLKLQNATLKDKVITQSKKIEYSVQYAKRIQDSLLPHIPSLPFSDKIFVLYQPKDVISGDFYWLYDNEKEDNIYYALVDCTGHGVPGALLSVVGKLYLNEIIQYCKDPASILSELNTKVRELLYNSNNKMQIYDGMEVALLKVSRDKRKMTFSGAMRDMILISNNQTTSYKGDRISINGHFVPDGEKSFSNVIIDFSPNDMVYLFSDGYIDQFGSNNKKFSKSNLEKQLLNIYSLGMLEQKAELQRVITEWMADLDQTDDITIIGLRLE